MYKSIHDVYPVVIHHPHHIKENYRACYVYNEESPTSPENPQIRILDDPSTGNTIDCPYPPSIGSSIYPGQACYDGIRGYNKAVTTGISRDSLDFPIPKCPNLNQTLPCSPMLCDPDVPPQLCNPPPTLSLQYIPNQDFSACIPNVQIPNPSFMGGNTQTDPSVMFYASKASCEKECVLPKTNDTSVSTSQRLTQAMKKGGFCTKLPLCQNASLMTQENPPRQRVQSKYACLNGTDDAVTYALYPPKENISCSKMLNILPQPPPGYSGPPPFNIL